MINFPSAEKSIFLEELSEPSIGKIHFEVQGDTYKGLESPWDFLCSTHPEEQLITIDPDVKAEFEAWDAASDEAYEQLDG